MFSLVLLGALMAGAPAGDVTVDVAKGDFKRLPAVKIQRDLPTPAMVETVQRIIGSGTCKLPGQNSRKFDVVVPFAVEVTPDGTTRHVMVADKGCPPLESFVGEIVLKLAAMGDFASYHTPRTQWVASEINFTQQ